MKRIDVMSKEEIVDILANNNTSECTTCIALNICGSGEGLNLTCAETIKMYFDQEIKNERIIDECLERMDTEW